jgi:hypothetical protein
MRFDIFSVLLELFDNIFINAPTHLPSILKVDELVSFSHRKFRMGMCSKVKRGTIYIYIKLIVCLFVYFVCKSTVLLRS